MDSEEEEKKKIDTRQNDKNISKTAGEREYI
jgi:hypothetical protein